MQDNLEIIAVDLHIVFKAVRELQRVFSPDIEGVTFKRAFEISLALLHLPKPHLVHAQ